MHSKGRTRELNVFPIFSSTHKAVKFSMCKVRPRKTKLWDQKDAHTAMGVGNLDLIPGPVFPNTNANLNTKKYKLKPETYKYFKVNKSNSCLKLCYKQM